MRSPRIRPTTDEADSFYHLISRIVGGEWLLGAVEKEMLRKHLWQVADYCGLQVLTHHVMDNHVHIIVRVPERAPVGDQELLRRYLVLHSGISLWERQHIDAIKTLLASDGDEAEEWRRRQLAMMGDISPYMQLLKQRFSIWYNRVHRRFGTLWAERFKSVLLEPGQALRLCAAYVDLNSFRANLCKDPKDYRFGGYAEAVAGNRRAREGIMTLLGVATWDEAQRNYRCLLFEVASNPKKHGRIASPESRMQVIAEQGGLPTAKLLGCRCRYLTDGAVLGSKAFVLEQLAEYRRRTGRGQRTTAWQFPELGTELAVMRKLRAAGTPA